MADEINIEEEFESDDEFLARTDTPPESNLPEETVAPPFGPGATSRKRQAEINQAQRLAKRQRQERIQAQKEILAEQRRAAMEQRKELRRQSQQQVTQARSDAISGRVQAYSLGAAAGFPGYIFGSAIDALFLRPLEQQNTQAQREYQAQLSRYYTQLDRDRREQQRQIQNQPIDATLLDEAGRPTTETSFVGPPRPPTPTGPSEPPRVPPTPPPNRGFSAGQFAVPVATVVTAVQALELFYSRVDSISQRLSSVGQTIGSGDATEGSKALTSTLKGPTRYLTNIPLAVSVESFSVLLDTNKAILASVKENSAFAPETLGASITSELAGLNKQIEVSRRLDKVTAQLVRANTQMELAFADFRAEIIETAAPAIILALNQLTGYLKIITFVIDNADDLLKNIPGQVGIFFTILGEIVEFLAQLVSNSNKANQMDETDILDQIDRFFDIPLTIGKLPPGTVPNP
jgi:uncharacterized membrane-anchored protein YhcB (DUF1043 family)